MKLIVGISALVICLCLCSATTVSAITESQTHKLYEEGVNLYKSGIQQQNIKYFKKALKDNIQGLDYALTLVDKYIVAHPQQQYVLDNKSLLIKLLKLAGHKSLQTEAHKLTDKDRYNSGYKQGVYDAGQYIANDTGSCSLQHHTVSYCDGYKAGFDARQSDDG